MDPSPPTRRNWGPPGSWRSSTDSPTSCMSSTVTLPTKEARLQLALAETPLLRSTLSSSSAWLDHEGRGSCTSWCQLAIQGGHHSAGAGAAGDHRCSCHHCHHHPGPGCSLMTTYSPSPSFLPEWLAAH
ncbi:putative GTP-binding protein 6 [Cricetulus griseus]|nr:putative GTP-binding protein 6 [Cricetulus griseus]